MSLVIGELLLVGEVAGRPVEGGGVLRWIRRFAPVEGLKV